MLLEIWVKKKKKNTNQTLEQTNGQIIDNNSLNKQKSFQLAMYIMFHLKQFPRRFSSVAGFAVLLPSSRNKFEMKTG